MIVSKTEYQGKPMLSFKQDENDKYPFTFGVKKAKIILDHFEDIQKFVEENE